MVSWIDAFCVAYGLYIVSHTLSTVMTRPIPFLGRWWIWCLGAS